MRPTQLRKLPTDDTYASSGFVYKAAQLLLHAFSNKLIFVVTQQLQMKKLIDAKCMWISILFDAYNFSERWCVDMGWNPGSNSVVWKWDEHIYAHKNTQNSASPEEL